MDPNGADPEGKGKQHARDKSPEIDLPQEDLNWFDKRTADYSPSQHYDQDLVRDFLSSCHAGDGGTPSKSATQTRGGFSRQNGLDLEHHHRNGSISNVGAEPSRQPRAHTDIGGIQNRPVFQRLESEVVLLGPELNRKLPKEGRQVTSAEDINKLDIMAPNREVDHDNNNNQCVAFQTRQPARNQKYIFNPLIHNFSRLPALTGKHMHRTADREELPPIRNIFEELSQFAAVTTNCNMTDNNGGINSFENQDAENRHSNWQVSEGRIPQGVNDIGGSNPRAMSSERFNDRGHSNGYVSFGDYTSADMPSMRLDHFSLANQHNNRRQGMAAYRPMDLVGGLNPSGTGAPTAVEEQPVFNIFQAMLSSPDLILTLARHLRVQELDILYSICKPFHLIVKGNITSVMVEQAKLRAPEGRKLFPWRCYGSLCMKDPNGRLHDVPEEAAKGVIRQVPNLRWLKMLCFREMVVHEIMTTLEEDGVGVPDQCEVAIKKLWFLMDVPDNRRRNALVQNRDIIGDEDLFFMMFFFVKLDKRFTDPITGGGQDGMRRMLLAQPTLATLWRALKRVILLTKYDVVQMFVRWKYEMTEQQAPDGGGVLGIHPNEMGVMQYEYWGRRGKGQKLEQIDDLLLLESIRRDLSLEDYYPDMFLWGYINPNDMENLPPVVRKRRLERLEGLEEKLVPEVDKQRPMVPKQVSCRVIVLD